MLELDHIRKVYHTGDLTQVALDDVSLAFRDSEFVAILGPSGSGKTTLLNVLGGLDRADAGDLIINGVSTKGYRSKDWDTYRNHNIGFVFQSYNLIPHQTILENVELALTLAGVGAKERKQRASAALERVGLGKHLNKRPAQLSGGQMQRVAIARALVNDPDIVLADEPTGALDGKTGIQIMDLLKEVAHDRLVIMVTHNPDLAESYATRIVRLADGKITQDSQPFLPAQALLQAQEVAPVEKTHSKKHASMSPATALSLSFKNLMSKKGRTFLTAFAGSIGIMGIAAILALSTGVNDYILGVQKDTMASYPISITKTSTDVSSAMGQTIANSEDSNKQQASDASADNAISVRDVLSQSFSSVNTNDLAAFKNWLETGTTGIENYSTAITYDYGIHPHFYNADASKGTTELGQLLGAASYNAQWMDSLGISGVGSVFQELLPDQALLDSQYDLVDGSWPQNEHEAVLVLSSDGSISDYALYALGVYNQDEYKQIMQAYDAGEKANVPDHSTTPFTYKDAMNLHYKVVPASARYKYNDATHTWADMSDDAAFMTQAIKDGIDVSVVGVIKPKDDGTATPGIAYSAQLTQKLMQIASDSDIVKTQLANPSVDVFTNTSFDELQANKSNFDLSSIFSVDTNKLTSAFSFDSSALSTSSASLAQSLSSLNLGDANGNSPFETLNLDALNLDTTDLSKGLNDAISKDTLKAMLEGAPAPDVKKLSETFSTDNQKAITHTTTQLATNFIAWWYQTHPGQAISTDTDLTKDLQTYLETSEAQALIGQLSDQADKAYGPAVKSFVDSYLQDSFIPYIQAQLQELATKAAQTMATSLAQQLTSQMASAMQATTNAYAEKIQSALADQMQGLAGSLQSGFKVDAGALASAIQVNISEDELRSLLESFGSANAKSYDNNLATLGYARQDTPQTVNIYPKSFEAKQAIYNLIDEHNSDLEAQGKTNQVIHYTDLMGVLLGSVNDIMNTITTVLIAFVSISLVVSSIMIAVITYISVLERKKEIGILRAMGASKTNVANVFNAETFLEGLLAGVLAIAVVGIASVPINAWVLATKNVPNVMQLKPEAALILIGISVVLTLVAGLIPASSASRKDPVEALRSE